MSDKNLSVLGGKSVSSGYGEIGEVKGRFLGMVRDDRTIGVIKRRHRTVEELGEAMVYLSESGYAGELIGDEDVKPWYNHCYAEVFRVCLLTKRGMNTFERRVMGSVPESYKQMRREWGQLPGIEDK